MLKNKLFPFISQYIHTYLFGFTEDQLSIGVSTGNVCLENLTLRNDTLNKLANTKHLPLWLKYGHISSISITCHIMNFIGEKPLDITINSPSIVLMPSHKLLLQDKDALPQHTPYVPFASKVFILAQNNDTAPTVDQHVNALLSRMFTYIQSSNFAVNVTINNAHVVIEDDQLLNHKGEFMFGLLVPKTELQLACEGNVKTNKLKCSGVQLYYNNTNIIPSKLFLTNISNIKDYYKLIDHDVIRNKIISNISDSAKGLVNVVEKCNVEGTFHVKHRNNVEQLFIRNEHCYDVFVNVKCSCVVVNVTPQVKEHVDAICDFITKFKLQKHLQKFRKKKVENMKDIVAYVALLNRVKAFNTANPLRKQFNKYYSLILRDYDKDKILFIDLNDTNDNGNKNSSSNSNSNSKALNNVTLNVNVNAVCNGINIYIFDSLCKRKVAVIVGTLQSNILLNQKEIKVNSDIKSIQIKTNETFVSNEKDVPRFQFKYGQSNTNSTNTSTNSNSNSIPMQNTAKNFIASHQLQNDNFSFFQGGLKESPLLDESPLVQRSQAKLYQEQARYIRKMRILSTTLGCPVNPCLPFRSNNYNPNTPKSFKSELLNESLTKSLQLSTEQSRSTDRQKQLRNDSISKAIAMYNNQKNKMTSAQQPTNHTVIHNTHNNNNLNLSTNNIFRNGISAINRNTPMSSANVTNNQLSSLHKTFTLVNPGCRSRNHNNRSGYTVKTKHTAVHKEVYSLPLLDISGVNNGDHILFEYTRQLNIKNTDVVNVTFHMIRVNFFREYVSSMMRVIGDYKANAATLSADKPCSSSTSGNSVRHVLTKLLSDNIKLQKYLFMMKQSLYTTLMCCNDKPNAAYKEYVLYLQGELAKYPFKERALSLFESNYLFSYYLSNSIEVNIAYAQFDFIFYQNVANVANHVLSHFKFAKNDIKLYLALSYVYVKCFGNEIEITDYEHIADAVIGLCEEFHCRFAKIERAVRPCVDVIKREQRESAERQKQKVATKDNKDFSELSRSIVLDSTPTKYKINFLNTRNRTMCQFGGKKNNTYESNSSLLVNQFVGNSKTYV